MRSDPKYWCGREMEFEHIEYAGGSPAATYLSCLAKNGKPKKAAAAPLTSPLS